MVGWLHLTARRNSHRRIQSVPWHYLPLLPRPVVHHTPILHGLLSEVGHGPMVLFLHGAYFHGGPSAAFVDGHLFLDYVGNVPLVPSIVLLLFNHHPEAGLVLVVSYLIDVFTSDRDI